MARDQDSTNAPLDIEIEGEPSGSATLEGEGTVVGKRAPDFILPDHMNRQVRLRAVLATGPALLAFYPGDFTLVCTKQLCNYRDNITAFREFGLQLFGISPNPSQDHSRFVIKYNFPFPLLTDKGGKVGQAFDCTSLFMLGGVSRAVVIVNRAGIILYRYVEPTIITRRSAQELLKILADLKANKLL